MDNGTLQQQHNYLVVPGQVIAVSSGGDSDNNGESSFLRGHGTYIETSTDKPGGEEKLVSSVCGIVHRVNKLVTVQSLASHVYNGQVGDLVVGRVVSVQPNRWKVSLQSDTGKTAGLPLSGVHLPGGVQRVRTDEDSRRMREYLQEGDLVSAEIHKVQPQDGSYMLHTRSIKYGKLENGILVQVPPALMVRRKHHSTILMDKFLVLWGCNGMVWIQRKMAEATALETNNNNNNQEGESNSNNNNSNNLERRDLAETQEAQKREHAELPCSLEERRDLARLRASLECLRMVHCQVSPETVQRVYQTSLEIPSLEDDNNSNDDDNMPMSPAAMVRPDNVLRLTAAVRQ